MLRSHQSKNFQRGRRKNALVGGRSCFDHLSCKKIAVPGLFCFGRTSQKNFRLRQAQKLRAVVIFASFAPVAKTIPSAVTCASFGPVKTKLRSADTSTSAAPVPKTFSRARHKKIGRWSPVFRSPQLAKKTVSGHVCFVRASQKRFGRARRRKTSVGVHFCIGRTRRKNFCRW